MEPGDLYPVPRLPGRSLLEQLKGIIPLMAPHNFQEQQGHQWRNEYLLP